MLTMVWIQGLNSVGHIWKKFTLYEIKQISHKVKNVSFKQILIWQEITD